MPRKVVRRRVHEAGEKWDPRIHINRRQTPPKLLISMFEGMNPATGQKRTVFFQKPTRRPLRETTTHEMIELGGDAYGIARNPRTTQRGDYLLRSGRVKEHKYTKRKRAPKSR